MREFVISDDMLYKAIRKDNAGPDYRWMAWVTGIYHREWVCCKDMVKRRKHFVTVAESDFEPEKSYEIDPLTLCRCTGVRDNDGQLIYASDVLERHSDKGVVTYAVVWNKEHGRFEAVELYRNFGEDFETERDGVCTDHSFFPAPLDNRYSVIGNLFDNEEYSDYRSYFDV